MKYLKVLLPCLLATLIFASTANASPATVAAAAAKAAAAAAERPPVPPSISKTVAKAQEDKFAPKITLSVNGRQHMTDTAFSVDIETYNIAKLHLLAYRIDLSKLISHPDQLTDSPDDLNLKHHKNLPSMTEILNSQNVHALQRVQGWNLDMGKIYSNDWNSKSFGKMKLPVGVYLLQARGSYKGKSAEARTWITITNIALASKGGPGQLVVYATGGNKGQPMGGLQLTALDEKGQKIKSTTAGNGMARFDPRKLSGNVFIYGTLRGNPAYIVVNTDAALQPYKTYSFTDRPIYRPGQKVLFKGTVRRRKLALEAGGVHYSPYANAPVEVSIRDSTDALVYQQRLNTDQMGSYNGDFALASEPVLGRWQLITTIGDYSEYAYFDVEEYRKPEAFGEVEIAEPHYLAGTVIPITLRATYYSGQPVTNAEVNIALSAGRLTKGNPHTTTDKNGEVLLEVDTSQIRTTQMLTISADVIPLSRRGFSMSGKTLVTAGLFRLSVQPVHYVSQAQKPFDVKVQAIDWDGKPVATPVTVTMTETREDNEHKTFYVRTNQKAVTDSKGQAIVTFTPQRPGRFGLKVAAVDSKGFEISDSSNIWIASSENMPDPNAPNYQYPSLSLKTDKNRYNPGDSATVLLNTNLVTARGSKNLTYSNKGKSTDKKAATRHYSGAWVWLTVQGTHLYSQRLIYINRRSNTLQVPVREEYFPAVRVRALIVQEGDIYTASAQLNVQRDAQKMNVEVTPDKQKYLPGKTARYTIKTTDASGKPVPAQVGMGVVDESIYALRKDITPDIEKYFWSEQQDLISTDFSMSKRYSGGAYQIMAEQAASQSNVQGIRLRKKFADTAYWNPDILTGADGTAQVDFTLPDNLTSWRATARGINAQTQVGQGTSNIQVNMPLEVHLALPRFYVYGDKAVVSASVHNNSDVDRDVKIHVQTVGATLQGDVDQTIHLKAHNAKRLTWHAEITTGTKVNGTPQKAYFTVSADGGDNAKDAMQLSLRVHPLGLKMVEAHAGGLYKKDATANIDLSKLPDDASIELEMKPSLAAVIYDGLDYIKTYPYQNAEQTASTLITNVAVASSLNLRSPGYMPADLRQQINFALQRLYRYQHNDGGWQMWEFDQSDPNISAYVLRAMARAKEAGFLVDSYRLQRGAEYLRKHIHYSTIGISDNNYAQSLLLDRADLIQRYSQVGDMPDVKRKTTRELAFDILAENNIIGSLEFQEETQKRPLSVQLQQVKGYWMGLRKKNIEELQSRAIRTGDLIRWKAQDKGHSWYNDDTETTALVLHALIDADFSNSLILPAMRWLLAQPWHSTKATAETVLAMTAYMNIRGELTPDYNVQLALDGKPLQHFSVNKKSLQEPPVKVLLSPEDWRGHHTLLISKSGEGSLYFTTTIRYLLPPSESNEADHGIKVTREYTVTVKNPSLSQKMESGTDMQVTLHLDLPESYRYVTLEEPIPAGYEVAPQDNPSVNPYAFSSYGSPDRDYYWRRDVRDDKVVYFFNRLPAGRTTRSYTLHAETPGFYSILPAIASLTYFPEIRGNSGLVQVEVVEKNGQ